MAPELAPRRYQKEILERAISGNVVAWMGTGSGKTYIAVMLIRYMMTRVYNTRKVVLFLANQVSLVQQQAAFIQTQTNLVVKGYSGLAQDSDGVRVDSWNKDPWQTEFNTVDVLVMTRKIAALLVNILGHGYWNLGQISLLIMDEAHHCIKAHPYSQIMRNYYRATSEQVRPKIFGMTASPIWNVNRREHDLQMLEENMNAQIVRVKLNKDELKAATYPPNEVVIYYPAMPLQDQGYEGSTFPLWDHLNDGTKALSDLLFTDALKARYNAVRASLGIYGADLYLFDYLQERISHLHDDLERSSRLSAFGLSTVSSSFSAKDELAECFENCDPIAIITAVACKLRDSASVLQGFDLSANAFLMSPKLKVLLDNLASKKAADFQGIIFVEQRHIATILREVLRHQPAFVNWIRPATLMGHGEDDSSFAKGMPILAQNEVTKKFRSKEYNLLIATSVAEEGLDFPDCDLIIRFDGLMHMIGYLQSRGRARKPNSTYVVMIAEDASHEIKRYSSFKETELSINEEHTMTDPGKEADAERQQVDFVNEQDYNNREVYTVESSGAKVTFDTAIAMLAHYCSTIPRDSHTNNILPTFEDWTEGGCYMSRVRLPPAVPIPREDLHYESLLARFSKKEARRAAAYEAVVALHQRFHILDHNLLPLVPVKGANMVDADGSPVGNVKDIPRHLEIQVVDPWDTTKDLLVHPIVIDGRVFAGLVSSITIPTFVMENEGTFISVTDGYRLSFSSAEDEDNAKTVMSRFTEFCINYMVTGKPLPSQVSAFIVPLLPDTMEVDYQAMSQIKPKSNLTHWLVGRRDWGTHTNETNGPFFVESVLERGRALLVLDYFTGKTASSPYNPEPGTKSIYGTHLDYYSHVITKRYSTRKIPGDDPLLLVKRYRQTDSTKYYLGTPPRHLESLPDYPSFLIPRSLCEWFPLDADLMKLCKSLPVIMQRATDLFRAQSLCTRLSLPKLEISHVVEALTLPASCATFSNQRLETLGDAVLKLAVVVHVFNKFPNLHEGQLSNIKTNSISNRILLCRGLELNLLQYTTIENQSMHTGRWTALDSSRSNNGLHTVRRSIPRRSVQDCMESLLGAAFVGGGVNECLRLGTRLNLCFGGEEAWNVRYRLPSPGPTPPGFDALQIDLGYKFMCGDLLQEALTHPSFDILETPCYQRLEFLGDALIDMVVMEYLFKKYPQATSGQLTWARSRAVCSATLTLVASAKFKLHKYLLHNSSALGKAISQYDTVLETCSYKEMIDRGWHYDPPKVYSDLVESVYGAIFIDSGYDYVLCKGLVSAGFEDVLILLSPDLKRDPAAELMMWVCKSGCRQASFRKVVGQAHASRYTVIVHGNAIGEPMQGTSKMHSKCLASEQALELLQSPHLDSSLQRICTCEGKRETKQAPIDDIVEPSASPRDLETPFDDETTEGFAQKAQHLLSVLASADAEESASPSNTS